MIGKTVKVIVDRPLGSCHPKHKDIYYPINYGYIEGIMAPDGENQDAYVLGVNEPIIYFVGKVIAIIHRYDDVEDKRVIAPENMKFSLSDIKEAVKFQEQYFKSEVFMNIRYATKKDLSRIAEIYVFNNRINYWPIFKDDNFSFGELQVVNIADNYFVKDDILKNTIIYDDGLIKGFIQIDGTEICKLYVDTFFQSKGIGDKLIKYAIEEYNVDNLWALEKNERAISFYKRNGFHLSGEKSVEEGTDEYLVHLVR